MTIVRLKPITDFNESIKNIFNKNVDGRFYPNADILEDEKNIYLNIELPGVEKKDINIKLSENILTISGEKKSEVNVVEKNIFQQERNYGEFSRSFEFETNLDAENIFAKFENGILKITAQKKNIKEKEKSIEII